jgi:predicted transcriptional regulator of viral defense system
MDRRLAGNLDRTARSQHGLVTREQLLKLGISSAQVQTRITTGALVRMRPGVYRISGAPSTWEQAVLGTCLAANAVASHTTACRLIGVPVDDEHRINITVTRGKTPGSLPGVAVHRTRTLGPNDTATYRGIPVTSPLRTLLDMSAVLETPQIETLTSDLLTLRRISTDHVARYLTSAGNGVGRRGANALRQVVKQLTDDGHAESEAERRVFRMICEAGLPRPVRQYVVRDEAGRFVARLDIAWPEFLYDLEVDGYRWHSSPEAFRRDHQRDLKLAAMNWTVRRQMASSSDAEIRELISSLVRWFAQAPRYDLCG